MTTAISEFIFFRSKTDLVYRHEWLCRSGNGHGGSILTPQAENKNCQSVGTCSTWKMQSWLENTSVAFLCNVYRTAVMFSVQITRYSTGVYVEGTTYNHGRPEGISEDQHPMNQFLGMLYGQVRP